MSEHGIWWDDTYNPFRGCSPKSAGCAHCWAAMMAHRMSWPSEQTMSHYNPAGWGNGLTDERGRYNGTTRVIPELLGIPLRWRKSRYVFVNSTSDTFHDGFSFEQIAAVYGIFGATPRHTYIVLTKRPERRVEFFDWLERMAAKVANVFPDDPLSWRRAHILTAATLRTLGRPVCTAGDVESMGWPLPNVIEGVSIEDQPTADERIPLLLQTPAARRMVSYEPSLGPVDFIRWLVPEYRAHFAKNPTEGDVKMLNRLARAAMKHQGHGMLDYVISGGESGHGARPSDVQWHRDVARQCEDAGAHYGLKQLGANIVGEYWGAGQIDDRPILIRDRIVLSDAKGADPSEWPADLRRFAITGPREFWGASSEGQ